VERLSNSAEAMVTADANKWLGMKTSGTVVHSTSASPVEMSLGTPPD
jgi:hypothetical protein